MTLRRITLATTLLPLLTMGALAQTTQQPPVQRQQQASPNDRALQLLIQGAVSRELVATGAVLQLQDQLAEAQQQIVALTKERDELKAKAVPAEAVKP
jgi:hypothetical protein